MHWYDAMCRGHRWPFSTWISTQKLSFQFHRPQNAKHNIFNGKRLNRSSPIVEKYPHREWWMGTRRKRKRKKRIRTEPHKERRLNSKYWSNDVIAIDHSFEFNCNSFCNSLRWSSITQCLSVRLNEWNRSNTRFLSIGFCVCIPSSCSTCIRWNVVFMTYSHFGSIGTAAFRMVLIVCRQVNNQKWLFE